MLILLLPDAFAEGLFREGTTELGISGGFGDNYHISSIDEDIEFYYLTPYWGKILRNWNGTGSFEFLLEGFFSYITQDSKDRYAIGITPIFRFNINKFAKVIPFIDIGGGVLITDLDPKGFGQKFNFTPQGGAGLRYEIASDQFVTFSYRFHHISNGGMAERNQSIDSGFYMIGFSTLM